MYRLLLSGIMELILYIGILEDDSFKITEEG